MIPRLATVDLGVNRCGLATWLDGRLVYVGEPSIQKDHGDRPWAMGLRLVGEVSRSLGDGPVVWWIEVPQDYDSFRVASGDLDRMREVLGWVSLWRSDGGAEVKKIFPRAWKGNVPKQIHQNRMTKLLREEEIGLIRALERKADAMDAVGLGLYVLGRSLRGKGRS